MKLKNKIIRSIKFYVKSNDASISPPIGTMLGQFPMDVKAFCNNFNNDTKNLDKGVLLKVVLILYKDGSFEYKIKSSPLSFLLELAIKNVQIQIRSKIIQKKIIFLYDLYLISLIKNKEYNLLNIKILFKQILKEVKKKKCLIVERIKNDLYYFYK